MSDRRVHDTERDFLFEFLRRRMGWALEKDRAYLLHDRLVPLAACHGLSGLAALVDTLRAHPEGTLAQAVCEAMSIGETYFFRDPATFDLLRNRIVPELRRVRAGSRRISIWCAACSTGQEPYSVAMMLVDSFPDLADWNLSLVATDANATALRFAREGLYSHFDAQRGLGIRSLVKHFHQEGNAWRVGDHLKRLVQFHPLNLATSLVGPPGVFDIVFLRNVLIYFEESQKTKVFEVVRRSIAEDGYLFLGGAEAALHLARDWASADDGAHYYVPQ